jgi:hypothetical protein
MNDTIPTTRHGNLTYKGLLDRLQSLTPEELAQTVTVFVGSQDEYYSVPSVDVTNEADVLDKGHLYLNID